MTTVGTQKVAVKSSALYRHLCCGYLLICHKYLFYLKIKENLFLYFFLFLNEKLPICLAFTGWSEIKLLSEYNEEDRPTIYILKA